MAKRNTNSNGLGGLEVPSIDASDISSPVMFTMVSCGVHHYAIMVWRENGRMQKGLMQVDGRNGMRRGLQPVLEKRANPQDSIYLDQWLELHTVTSLWAAVNDGKIIKVNAQ